MTYPSYPQPYPGAGGSNQMPGPVERGPQPASLRNAVRLMIAGAAIALIGVIITLAFSSKIKSAVTKAAIKANATRRGEGKTVLTASQIHSLANITVVFLAVIGIIGVLLWLWMAWANNRGRNWARIVATVLFALDTISLIFEVGRASVSFIFVGLGWLIGLVTIVFLWRKTTTEYIQGTPRA
jgi:hypothetical protein